MAVLWTHGPSTVAQVRERLEDDLAYTTVLTILRTLEEKGHVGHEVEGRAHCYHATVELPNARRDAADWITRKLFGGRIDLLLTHLVSEHEIPEGQLDRTRTLLEDRNSTA